MLRAHAEQADRLSRDPAVRRVIAPMVPIIGACDAPEDFTWYGHYGTPEDQGCKARQAMLQMTPADRWVNLVWLVKPTLLWLESLGIEKVLAGELPRGHWPEVENLRKAQIVCGIRPSRIYTDTEYGWSRWQLGGERVRDLLKDPAIKRVLPLDLAECDPDAAPRFVGEPDTRKLVIAWGKWTALKVLHITQKILTDSGWLGKSLTGSRPMVIGAFNINGARFPVLDMNGWPMSDTPMPGIWQNNAQMYLGRGSLDGLLGLKKHSAWNALIREVNIGRAAPGVHTLCPPAFLSLGAAGPWVFDRLVGHVARGGTRQFSYWNGEGSLSDPAQDALVAGAINAHASSRTFVDLPPVSFDADEIVSGDLHTTYDEFTRHLGVPAS